MTDPGIRTSEAVQRALAGGGAVVALESTVVAHGLPRPRNLEVGRLLESAVRECGAVPATVGVVAGVPTVGLSDDELERLASGGGEVMKLSTRDLPMAAANGRNGATTVAATSWLAAHAGIAVFATGGIGGVHRGEPRDVSADVGELGRTSIVVVCSGAKSILDLPATLEALETAAVAVIGWRTDQMPAFYSRESGLALEHRVESAEEVARVFKSQRRLGIPGALLVCAPPPAESALPADEVERAIGEALADADRRGVRGGRITPFLLDAVARATQGRSLEANVALLRNNARIAAEIAIAVAGA